MFHMLHNKGYSYKIIIMTIIVFFNRFHTWYLKFYLHGLHSVMFHTNKFLVPTFRNLSEGMFGHLSSPTNYTDLYVY